MIKKGILIWCFLMGISFSALFSQKTDVYIDDRGIMRWPETNEEVYGFGVNYTVPFAHAYRSAERLGISQKEAIDNDVYHFSRLGFDAYRVHVWDTEISDTLGNLLENEHLDVFDYMLKQMKDRGMKFLLTPIAFWGNGWPEPDSPTPGFSSKYGKDAALTNEAAIKAQENYLFQFLNHVNPYTGIAYKNDPAIIAFEISNEPHHRQPADSVARYVKKLVTAMRKTGSEKPILYNMSHGIHLASAYFDGGAQGGTFQWYPTGLGAGEELQGNFLPNVDRYEIPFADNPKFKKGAKVVYEFDAADVGRSYIYPAMARSFRTAGIQWATHFAYDPTYLAYANTEYNTHYMNLVFTPQKALSLKLAGEVFHRIPVYKDFGKYPENVQFDEFYVSYEKDLAELNTERKFIYTNHTTSQPVDVRKLEEIAGYGNSAVVRYDGQGAYFLDKIEKGVWRLEVLPDAQIVADPYGKNSLNRTLAVINWQTRPMSVDLSDLGEELSIKPINEKNSWQPEVNGKSFSIRPGTYLIVRNGAKTKLTGTENWKNITLNEYFAPASTLEKAYVLHEPNGKFNSNQPYTVKAKVVTKALPKAVKVVAFSGWRPMTYEMKKGHGYNYTAEIPAENVKEGFLKYFIVVEENDSTTTFPGAMPGKPGDWDFDATQAYTVSILPPSSPVYLFNAFTDNEEVSRPWNPESSLLPLPAPGKAELRLAVNELFTKDPENPNAKPVYNYAMRYCFKDQIKGRKDDLNKAKDLVLQGQSLMDKDAIVQLALITKDGQAFGGNIKIGQESGEYRLSLNDLEVVKLVTLPRPYPTFLPYFFDRAAPGDFNLSEIETLQISIGPGLSDVEKKEKQAVAIESVRLE